MRDALGGAQCRDWKLRHPDHPEEDDYGMQALPGCPDVPPHSWNRECKSFKAQLVRLYRQTEHESMLEYARKYDQSA